MKKLNVFLLFIISNFWVFAQSDTTLEKLAVEIADDFYEKIRTAESLFQDYYGIDANSKLIKIYFPNILNSKNEFTLLSKEISDLLISHLADRLNNVDIKFYQYSFVKDSNSNFDLKISAQYFISEKKFIIKNAKISDNKNQNPIFLGIFSYDFDIEKLKNLDIPIYNQYFELFKNLKSNADFLDSIKIKEFSSNSFVSDFQLDTSKKYWLFIYKKPKNFVYVFFYEPKTSTFTCIYPYSAGYNRIISQSKKAISFTTDNKIFDGYLQILITKKKIPLYGVSETSKNLSADNVMKIYEFLKKNKIEFDNRVFKLRFK